MSVVSRCALVVLVLGFAGVVGARAAQYRIIPPTTNVLAGQAYTIGAEVQTMAGDNVVGIGYYSFAVDLTLTGTAGATGTNIGNIAINTSLWDDVQSNQIGHAQANKWVGCGGVTQDVTAPNFGSTAGDVIQLFTFSFTVPVSAQLGQTITITPSEGFLQSLTVDQNFDPVLPQNFTSSTLTVVPEPAGLAMLLVSAVGSIRRRCRIT